MLKAILDLKGEKRFRRQRNTEIGFVEDKTNARNTFRQMNNKTSYNRHFGERPKEEEAFKVVNKKRFSELDLASILKPEAMMMIEKWIANESEEEFTARVFFTLREMYTIVKGKTQFSTTNKELFVDAPLYEGSQPARFDLFEKSQNAFMRQSNSNVAK